MGDIELGGTGKRTGGFPNLTPGHDAVTTVSSHVNGAPKDPFMAAVRYVSVGLRGCVTVSSLKYVVSHAVIPCILMGSGVVYMCSRLSSLESRFVEWTDAHVAAGLSGCAPCHP